MKREKLPSLSIVIPVHNEIEVLPRLCSRLLSVLSKMEISHELVFVDDGSVDGSIDWLSCWGDKHLSNYSILVLSRCFGKENAVSAGLQHSKGERVVVMDADLQDPPEMIPEMYAALRGDIDVIAMRRSDRSSDSFFKRVTAKIYYQLMSRSGDIDTPTDVGDFRMMSRQVVDAVNSLPEQNRCLKSLFALVGFRCEYIDYARPQRAAGETKWSVSALFNLATDSITSHSLVPLRMATFTGLLVSVVALLYGISTVTKTVIFGEPVAGYTTLLLFITLLGSMQLLAIGILGEYVGRSYMETKRRPLYLVKNTLRSKSGFTNITPIAPSNSEATNLKARTLLRTTPGVEVVQ